MPAWTDYILQLLEAVHPLIGALAWPAVAMISLLVFKKQIYTVLDKLAKHIGNATRLKVGGFEVEFAKARQAAASLDLPKEVPSSLDQVRPDAYLYNPRGLIVDYWIRVEQRVQELLVASGSSPAASRGQVPVHIAIQQLSSLNVINEDVLRTVNSLRRVRNQIMHDPFVTPDPSDAYEFASMVERVLAALSLSAEQSRPNSQGN